MFQYGSTWGMVHIRLDKSVARQLKLAIGREQILRGRSLANAANILLHQAITELLPPPEDEVTHVKNWHGGEGIVVVRKAK